MSSFSSLSGESRSPACAPLTMLAALAILICCGSDRPARAAETKASAPDARKKATPDTAGWQNLFDGKSLQGWAVTDFAGHGEVKVEKEQFILDSGLALTGANFTNPVPNMDYEVVAEAQKLSGNDFFFGLTMPVGKSHCTLVLGGWGGAVTGISSVDGADASENETTKFMKFDTGQWYRIRARVTKERIEAWIDDEQIVNLATKDRQIAMRPGEIELSVPFGIATYQTATAIRSIKLRRLAGGSK